MEDFSTLNKTEIENFINIYSQQLEHLAIKMLEVQKTNKKLYKHYVQTSKEWIYKRNQLKELLNPKPKTKSKSKRSEWKDKLVYDLVTNKVIRFEDYCISKQLIVKKANTWHIDNETEVKVNGQKLNARWHKE